MKLEELSQIDVVSVRLVRETPLLSDRSVNGPEDAIDIIGKYLSEMDREVLCVVNLQTDGRPINCHFASVGAINATLTHPRELLKATILSNANSMILMHNHPSGNLNPSKEDTKLTDQIAKLCKLMQIELMDHIIVSGRKDEYFSFREKGILPMPKLHYVENYEYLHFKPAMVAEEKGKAR